MLKRAQLTQRLELDLPRDGTSLQPTLRALMQVPGGFGRLTGLSFRASPQSEEDKEHHKMAVAWLLGQAKELVFLSLDLVGLPYLPHLSHIQHLQLDVSGGAFPRLAPVLTTLVTLRTLYLESTETQGAQEEATGLDLQILTELESVMLDGAMPSALTLAEGTSLHVTVYSIEDACNGLWLSAGRALRSFTLQADGESIASEDEIPPWMLEPIRLETLVLALYSFGRGIVEGVLESGHIELQGAFMLTERMCFDCVEGLFVSVRRKHEWKLVNFHSCGRLDLEMMYPAHFVASCPAFSIRYDHLNGVDLICLASCLTKNGITFEAEQVIASDYNCKFYGAPQLGHLSADHHDELDLHNVDSSLCRCGACHICCRLDNFHGPRVPDNDLY